MYKQIFLLSIIPFIFIATAHSETYRKPLPNIGTTLDPHIFSDAYTFSIINQLYDRLFDIDELNTVKPKLVSNWEINNDGTIYKICLKDNVQFHDGGLLTANDVVFTLQRILSRGSLLQNEFSIIKGAKEFQYGRQKIVNGIKILSPLCLTIQLEKPFPPFINMLAIANTEILPDKLRNINENEFFKHPVGTGPFKISKYDPGHYVELSANEGYFLGAPKLKTLIYEKTTRIDAITKFNKEYYHDLEWFYPQTTELSKNCSIIKTPVFQTAVLAPNLRTYPLNNIHVRRALRYAINKKMLVDACFPGNKLAHGYVPPGLGGSYSKNVSDSEYNPNNAKHELKLSQIPKDILKREITILRPDNYPCKELFKKFVESDLKEIGINANVVHMPFSQIMAKHYSPRNFEMINILFTADFPEALFFLGDFRSNSLSNYSGFSSPEVDSLLKLANTSNDRLERYQIYEKIQKILYDSAATINLFYNTASIVLQQNVKGYTPMPLGLFYSSMWPVYLEDNGK